MFIKSILIIQAALLIVALYCLIKSEVVNAEENIILKNIN